MGPTRTTQLAGGALVPAPRWSLHGRTEAIDAVHHLLLTERARVVTLVGPGGVGKTRLAIEIARRTAPELPDGAAFVRLSSVTDPTQVLGEVCRQLGVASLSDHDPGERLRAALGSRAMLLVLDNLEQVAAAGPDLASLSADCPELWLMLTSRLQLHLESERVVRVAPLTLSAEDAGVSPALGLYCDRARIADPELVLDEPDRAAAAEICRRLDGLPLAIELAAARSATLPPRALLDRLDRDPSGPWRLLRRVRADGGPHAGLHETISWSVALLEPAAAVLFRRLGAFSGSWSVEAAEAVCGGDAALPADAVLDALAQLVELHLVTPLRQDGINRFLLLDTVRLVSRELLRNAGEQHEYADRHAEYYRTLMLAASPAMESPQEPQWHRRLDDELAEALAALGWLSEKGRYADLAACAVALGPYWLNRGEIATGRRWLDAAERAELPPQLAAEVRGWSLRLAVDSDSAAAASDAADALLAALEQVRDELGRHGRTSSWLRAGDHLAYALRIYGNVPRAEQVTQEALAECAAPGRGWWRSEYLLRAAILAEQRGDPAAAQALARQALSAANDSGNLRVAGRARHNFVLAGGITEPTAALRELQDVLTASEEAGDRRGVAATLTAVGAVAEVTGDPQAGTWYLQAIQASTEIGYRNGVALGMAGVMGLAIGAEEWTTAATLRGALRPHLEALRRQLTQPIAQAFDLAVEGARARAGAEVFDAAATLGTTMSWDQAVGYAVVAGREVVGRPRRETARSPAWAALGLTDRELEVLSLMARGMTNLEIAGRLVISAKTVMHHSGHIYAKLGVRGRPDAVAWAIRNGLDRATAGQAIAHPADPNQRA